jgi:lysophospholipase L1-like esterase
MVTIALVAPNLLLTLAGGPGGPRFTQPWFGVSSSDAVLGYLDPEQRLFSDTALTGRYRQVDEGRRTQPETKRVVVLGGSQTYGEGFTGSAHPPIWTERLGAAHPEWTIVNLAVQGSTLASQTIRLEHYAQVHPDQHTDAIVAVFGLNDLAFLRADPRREDRNAAVRRGELSPLAADPCAYLAACSGPRLLGRAVPFFLGRRVGADAEKLAAVERALRKLAALGHDWGATLVLVREPHQCELTSCADTIAPYDYPSAFDRARPVLDELARQPSVRLVDPALWLRARRATQPFFDAVHFSEAGHDAMAGALDPALDEALR